MQSGLNGITSPTGSGNHRYRPPGLGAKTRMTQSRLRDEINARDYGVVADGRVDDTLALRRACAAAIAQNRPLMLPVGNVKVTGNIIINAGITIKGFGQGESIITMANTTMTLFSITTGEQCYFHNFQITASGVQTAGTAFAVDPGGTTVNYESMWIGVRFFRCWTGIDFGRAAYFRVDNCNFEECLAQNIVVRNLVTSDEGDSFITNCLFSYFQTITSVNCFVYWESSGGLKIVGNKMNGGFRPIYFNLASGAGTGSMVIAGNSIESFTSDGIFIGATTTAPVVGTMSKIVITGNEIGGFNDGNGIKVSTGSTATWLTGVVITGNVIACGINSAGTVGHGVDLDFMREVTIVGNTFLGGGGSTIGIIITANVSQAVVNGNSFFNWGTNQTNNSTSPIAEFFPATVTTNDTYRARSGTPGMWLDETDGGVKGAYMVLDGGALQTQRRATNFGAFEATLQTTDITSGALSITQNIATPAGGTTGTGLKFGTTTNLGIFYGSGLPTLSAAQGSLYIRSDGSSTTTRMYINTNGTTGWTNVITTA